MHAMDLHILELIQTTIQGVMCPYCFKNHCLFELTKLNAHCNKISQEIAQVWFHTLNLKLITRSDKNVLHMTNQHYHLIMTSN